MCRNEEHYDPMIIQNGLKSSDLSQTPTGRTELAHVPCLSQVLSQYLFSFAIIFAQTTLHVCTLGELFHRRRLRKKPFCKVYYFPCSGKMQ